MEVIFENKAAVVTGGSSGIGRATANALMMHFDNLVVASRMNPKK